MAAMPVAELRISLPVAVNVLHMPLLQSLFLSIIGNLLPVPFLLLFYESLTRLIIRTDKGKRFIAWLYKRTMRQTVIIEKYKRIGLIIFVAIPLPGTGAWTASIAAQLLGLRFGHALKYITAGVIIAGIIVAVLVSAGWIGAAIAGIGIIILTIIGLWRF